MTEQEMAELDLAVAKAEGWIPCWDGPGFPISEYSARVIGIKRELLPVRFADKVPAYRNPDHDFAYMNFSDYSPTRDPAEAMRLLEKYGFGLAPHEGGWMCGNAGLSGRGATPCLAICAAVVALKGRK